MKDRPNSDLKHDLGQKGAALVTVILISALLLTASVAMLTAVGANSKNTSDVLSGTKAYYAAESGIQATINVLRNTSGVDYNQAVAHPDMSPWVGTNPVAVGTEASYSLNVTDPDGSSNPIQYTAVGSFQQADGTYASSRVYGSGTDTLTISYNNATGGPVSQPMAISSFGSFQIVRSKSGGTAAITGPLYFRVDYTMTSPRAGIRSLRGSISTSGVVQFLAGFTVEGSAISLCTSTTASTCRTTTSDGGLSLNLPTATLTPQTTPLYGKIAPLVPYRLKVVSTGFGPNGAMKQLEAILENNFFDDIASTSAITMIGPGSCMTFTPGTAGTLDILGGSGPSITVSDTQGLSVISAAHVNGTISPPPEVSSSDAPAWQSSPAALDALIRQLRQTAVNTGRYFANPTAPTDFGDNSTGKGLTFCEGDCTMSGNTSGGGILVVTGTLYTGGKVNFNGLILAVGAGGVSRSGNGNGAFTGNLVIAPYNPNNLAAGWGCPSYQQNGGAGDVINSTIAVDQAFDGTPAISDFVAGVAEK